MIATAVWCRYRLYRMRLAKIIGDRNLEVDIRNDRTKYENNERAIKADLQEEVFRRERAEKKLKDSTAQWNGRVAAARTRADKWRRKYQDEERAHRSTQKKR